VVILSSNDHPRVIRRAQQFGAAGFIPKSAPAETIGEAVQAVLDGGLWFPAMAAERSEADALLASRLAQLTRSSSACCCAWPMACSTSRSPTRWGWPRTR
jgi:DNA-binding NarL/FixJ family response regulator